MSKLEQIKWYSHQNYGRILVLIYLEIMSYVGLRSMVQADVTVIAAVGLLIAYLTFKEAV